MDNINKEIDNADLNYYYIQFEINKSCTQSILLLGDFNQFKNKLLMTQVNENRYVQLIGLKPGSYQYKVLFYLFFSYFIYLLVCY